MQRHFAEIDVRQPCQSLSGRGPIIAAVELRRIHYESIAYMPWAGAEQRVEASEATMRDLVDQMVAMIDPKSWSIDGNGQRFGTTIAGARIEFDATISTASLAFEQLASLVEAAISTARVRHMIDAAGMTSQPLPLWLVSGSDVLSKWLVWAGAGKALRKALTLTDEAAVAPVAGYLDRRARRELGQGGARIRVRGGIATAERLELSDHPRCIAILGQRARVRIERHKFPETVMLALRQVEGQNALRPLADVVSHSFFASADLKMAAVSSEGTSLVFEVESRQVPLEPIPAAAWSVLPADADPASPWRATAGERRRLDGLVEEVRHRLAATGGRR